MSTSTPKCAELNSEQRRFIDALMRVGNNAAFERVARDAGIAVDAEKVISSLPPGWVRTYQVSHYPGWSRSVMRASAQAIINFTHEQRQ